MIDYTIFYKSSVSLEAGGGLEGSWDVFISAYNSSERVRLVYEKVSALRKYWLLHPEYCYSEAEHPTERSYSTPPCDEGTFITGFFEELNEPIVGQSICIDITGFMRPHLMFLLLYLRTMGATRVDVLYSEPVRYAKKEKTSFSDEVVQEVRQVAGFEGSHVIDTNSDLLVLGTGYDHALIAHVAEYKDNARKVQIFGLPSLAADMYQENVIRAHRASESVGGGLRQAPDNFFAPANDPFVTAAVLSRIVADHTFSRGLCNLYLCPVGTKVQALGFAVYYLTELQGRPASIIFPFCQTYTRETSKGVSRVWKYTIELAVCASA